MTTELSASSDAPAYLRYWLLITLASLAVAVGTVIFVFSSLHRGEGWAVIEQNNAYTIAANIDARTDDGLWIAAISKSHTLRSFDPSVTLMFTQVDCEKEAFRVTSSIRHFDQEAEQTEELDLQAAWRPVPPASAGAYGHNIYQAFCRPEVLASTPLTGTPFDLRQSILSGSS